MAHFEKWIEDISADDSVWEAAQRSLRARLAAVQHFLPLAAERPNEDVEYVHELRVFTRRAVAALRLYASVLPKKEAKWFHKTLRKIRRAAGQARDMDVLAQSHHADAEKGADAFLVEVRERRQAAQQPIVSIHRKLQRKHRLRRHVEDLLAKSDNPTSGSEHVAFADWAKERLRKTLKRFFKASPSDLRDLDGLHRFRIRGKELRYEMELLALAFPIQFRNEIYPVVEELQERLGQIHDSAVARERFGRWTSETRNETVAIRVHKRLDAEHDRLKELTNDFASWWTPDCEARLRAQFDRLLARPPAVVRS